MISFKVGDNAVYPGQGVGEVTAIDEIEIFGIKQKFYSVKIKDSGTKFTVPEQKIPIVGLRPVISKEQADEVMDILKQKNAKKLDNQTWNRRHREYVEKIKKGSVYEVAEVLRDLFTLKDVKKDLSFGEKNLLDTARGLLWKELCLAVDEDALKSDEVTAIFGHDEIK